jgi:hypothetical protein
VGTKAGIDGCGKCRPHRDSIPRSSSTKAVAIPATLPRPTYHYKVTNKTNVHTNKTTKFHVKKSKPNPRTSRPDAGRSLNGRLHHTDDDCNICYGLQGGMITAAPLSLYFCSLLGSNFMQYSKHSIKMYERVEVPHLIFTSKVAGHDWVSSGYMLTTKRKSPYPTRNSMPSFTKFNYKYTYK